MSTLKFQKQKTSRELSAKSSSEWSWSKTSWLKSQWSWSVLGRFDTKSFTNRRHQESSARAMWCGSKHLMNRPKLFPTSHHPSFYGQKYPELKREIESETRKGFVNHVLYTSRTISAGHVMWIKASDFPKRLFSTSHHPSWTSSIHSSSLHVETKKCEEMLMCHLSSIKGDISVCHASQVKIL